MEGVLQKFGAPAEDQQRLAGLLLMEHFYTWVPCPWDIPYHLPMPCFGNSKRLAGCGSYDKAVWDRHRDEILGSEFRFTIQDFATGAFCPYPRMGPWL